MKKKNFGILIASLVCGASVLGAVGCSGDQSLTPDSAQNVPELSYSSNYEGPSMDGIVFDGKLDESVWGSKKYYTDTFAGNVNGDLPRMKVIAFTDEYGAYIGATVYDTNLCWNDKGFVPGSNSNLEFYFVANDVGTERDDITMNRHQLNIDLSGLVYGTGERLKRGISIDGEVNSQNTVSATWEMFIPWEEMWVDTSKGIPESFGLCPTYRAILRGNSFATILYPGITSPMGHPLNYFEFDKDGYINADKEGALLGDNKIGRAKTANWDLSKVDEGTVIRKGGLEWQSIYFKESYDENLSVTTTIYPIGDCTNGRYGGQFAGLHLISSEGYHHTAMLDFRVKDDAGDEVLVNGVNGTKNVNLFRLITLDNYFKGWNQVVKKTIPNPNVQTNEGIKFQLVKDGGMVHYFIDDAYFMSEDLSAFLSGKVYAGFYSLNLDVEFRGCEYEVYTAAEVDAVLEEMGVYSVKAEPLSAGGTVTTSVTSVYQGESVDLEIVLKSGYTVETVTLNGEDQTEAFKAGAVKGVYTLENVRENVLWQVKFRKLADGEGVKLAGKVLDGENEITAEMEIYGVDEQSALYTGKATRAGFNFVLPQGKYVVTAKADGYVDYIGEITLSADTETNLSMTGSTFLSTALVNKLTINSSVAKWDLSKEAEGKAIGSFDLGTKMAPLYFQTVGSVAIAETKITYSGGFEQDDLFGGFIVSDGTNTGWIAAHDTGITYNWVYKNGLLDAPILKKNSTEQNKTVVFKVVLYKGNFYVFINGEHVYSILGKVLNEKFKEESDYAFGLYMIADKPAEATFSEYSVRVGEDVLAEVETLLQGKGTVKIDVSSTLGGFVEADYYEVWTGDSVKFNVLSSAGYAVEKVEIDGVDKTSELAETAEKGSFVIENVTADTRVFVTFKKAETTVTYSGQTTFDGDPLSCDVMLYGVENNLLVYTQKTTADNGFTFKVAAGSYLLVIAKEGFVRVEKTVELTENKQETIEMKKSTFAGSVKVNGVKVNSAMDKWDFASEYDGEIVGSHALGTKGQKLWFKEAGVNAVVETTATYSGGFEQPDLLVGFAITDGANSGWILLSGRNLRVGWNDADCRYFLWEEELMLNTSSEANKTVDYKLIAFEGHFYFYVNGTLAFVFSYEEVNKNFAADKELAYSIYMVADAAAEATFTKYSIKVDDEASEEIENTLSSSKRSVTYLFLGDSYIDDRFWKSYQTEFGALSQKNDGVGGTKTTYWKTKAAGLAKVYSAKHILFHIGINDINGDKITAEQLIARLDEMFAAYKAAFPTAKLYWISLSPNNFANGVAEQWNYSQVVNAYMKTKDGVKYLDVQSKIGADAGVSVAKFYNSDGLHFNSLGYYQFTKTIKDAFLLAMVGEEPKAIYLSNKMSYDEETKSVKDTNTGTGASYLYFDAAAATKAYLKTTIHAFDVAGDVLAGFTITDGTYSAQIYLHNYGVLRLKDYAWGTPTWWNELKYPEVVNGHEANKVSSFYTTGSGCGYITTECIVANGNAYIFFNGVLNVQVALTKVHESFTAAGGYRVGFASWDTKGRGYEFKEITHLVGTDADTVITQKLG